MVKAAAQLHLEAEREKALRERNRVSFSFSPKTRSMQIVIEQQTAAFIVRMIDWNRLTLSLNSIKVSIEIE